MKLLSKKSLHEQHLGNVFLITSKILIKNHFIRILTIPNPVSVQAVIYRILYKQISFAENSSKPTDRGIQPREGKSELMPFKDEN